MRHPSIRNPEHPLFSFPYPWSLIPFSIQLCEKIAFFNLAVCFLFPMKICTPCSFPPSLFLFSLFFFFFCPPSILLEMLTNESWFEVKPVQGNDNNQWGKQSQNWVQDELKGAIFAHRRDFWGLDLTWNPNIWKRGKGMSLEPAEIYELLQNLQNY